MTAYERATAQKLALAQAEQRAMEPKKIGQKLLRDFCGRASGFGAVMDPFAAAELVRLVESIVIAERAAQTSAE